MRRRHVGFGVGPFCLAQRDQPARRSRYRKHSDAGHEDAEPAIGADLAPCLLLGCALLGLGELLGQGAELLGAVQRSLDASAESCRLEREVVDAIPAYLLALDEQDRIVLWNEGLERITGFDRAEMLGQPGGELIGAGPVGRAAGGVRGDRRVRSAGDQRAGCFCINDNLSAGRLPGMNAIRGHAAW